MNILLALLILELVLRLFKLAPRIPVGHNIYKQYDDLHYGLKPDISQVIETTTYDCRFNVKHNSKGFRDYEHPEAKKSYRIVALGDSFTYGWGAEYEQTFLRILERWLGVEIVKLGVPGYDTVLERQMLEARGLAYNPDMVLLCISPSDIFEVRKHNNVVDRNGYLRYNSPLFAIVQWLFFNSHLCRLILKRISRFITAGMMYDKNNFKIINREVLRMNDISKANGFKFVVMFLPDLLIPGMDEFSQEVAKVCKENGIDFINACFQDEDCFWKDGHCNPAGNSLIAKLAHNRLSNIIKRGTI